MIEQICDQIYESVRGIGAGHIVWCPVPHLEEVPRILEVDRAVSTAHFASTFQIVQLSSKHFKARQKLPIKALSLHDTEELLVSKAKKRPCVVVSDSSTAFADAPVREETRKRKHLQDESVLIAPIYGVATADDASGFPPIMTARIRALMYNQFFYLPRKCPRSGVSIGKEGIVRLDRVFSASPSRGMEAGDCKLSDEPFGLLRALLRQRLGGQPNPNLNLYREILYDSIPTEALPKS